jgi:hypothetical protein
MSTLSPSPLESEDAERTDARLVTLRQFVSAPPATVRTIAFWLAVALPFLYLPLLASGVTTPGERGALATMLALNVVALYAGHDYQPE